MSGPVKRDSVLILSTIEHSCGWVGRNLLARVDSHGGLHWELPDKLFPGAGPHPRLLWCPMCGAELPHRLTLDMLKPFERLDIEEGAEDG